MVFIPENSPKCAHFFGDSCLQVTVSGAVSCSCLMIIKPGYGLVLNQSTSMFMVKTEMAKLSVLSSKIIILHLCRVVC